MKDYDTAAHQFYASLNIKAIPIHSWDFHNVHFDTLCHKNNDLVTLQNLSKQNAWATSVGFKEALLEKEQIIVVTDVHLNIIHTSHNMVHMNGYTPSEVIGKNPKMFQGSLTSKETTNYISTCIKAKRPFEAVIINYHKNGTPYKCRIQGKPVFNKKGTLVNFIAFERKVA